MNYFKLSQQVNQIGWKDKFSLKTYHLFFVPTENRLKVCVDKDRPSLCCETIFNPNLGQIELNNTGGIQNDRTTNKLA